MKRPADIKTEEILMSNLAGLSGVFEGVASMRISQIKNQVMRSNKFFNELWSIYSQIRVDSIFRFGRGHWNDETNDTTAYVIITAEGGFSGDIDQKLVRHMLKSYDPEKNKIIVVGRHGAMQLAQRGVKYEKYYKMPVSDDKISTYPLIRDMQKYKKTIVFYQHYVSLSEQRVSSVDVAELINERREHSAKADKSHQIINESNYIFEPDAYELLNYLESSMLNIVIGQLILNSKLAQYASRFVAMTSARQRSTENRKKLHLDYNKAERTVKDERLKEVVNGLKKVKAAQTL
jgi:F-type H+-transporting ATPase subunit gamma